MFVVNSHRNSSTASEFSQLELLGEDDEGDAPQYSSAFITTEAENIQARRLTVHAQIKDVTSCE